MTPYAFARAVGSVSRLARPLCSRLAHIVGVLFRRRLAVAIVLIAGGTWMVMSGGVLRIWPFSGIRAALGGPVALEDCKFPLPRNGEFGPACACKTTSQASYIYLPNKDGELIALNHTDDTVAVPNGPIDVYGYSSSYPNYLYVQQTWVWDLATKSSMRFCVRNSRWSCIVGLIAADRVADKSCRYER